MLKFSSTILAFCLLLQTALALTAEDLSPEAAALLPEIAEVTLTLKNGSTHSGQLTAKTPEKYVLKTDRGRGITFQQEFAAADVRSVQHKDVEDLLAAALVQFKEKLDGAASEKELKSIAALTSEFVQKAPDHRATPAIKTLLDDAQHQVDQSARGLQKIDGAWHPPVQAAIMKYDLADQRIRDMEEKFRGINADAYPANPRAKQFYDGLVLNRRETARALPQIMAERMNLLLAEKNFDEAVEELNAFQTFFLTRVIGSEASSRRLDPGDARLFEQTDVQQFFRMQQRIIDAYIPTQPVPKVNLEDTSEMVTVPAGFFARGNKNATPGSDNFPAVLTYVDAFEIDRYEVSNAEYREFVDYVERTGDSSMDHPDAPPLKNRKPAGWQVPELSGDDQPVVGVDWFDAYAYAKWKGKRLPTEAEWEKAARGIAVFEFPWGDAKPAQVFANNPSGRQALANRITQARMPPPDQRKGAPAPPPFQLPKATWPVKSLVPEEASTYMIAPDLPAVSPYGVYHMAGNAAEWAADAYNPRYYYQAPTRNPVGPETGADRVIRGGSFIHGDTEITTHHRLPADARNPNYKKGVAKDNTPFVGFRCAK
jgi:formylglycine-generating enzyme required for sulfatase activity